MDRHLILGKVLGYEGQDLTDSIKKAAIFRKRIDYEPTLRETEDKKLGGQREREKEL